MAKRSPKKKKKRSSKFYFLLITAALIFTLTVIVVMLQFASSEQLRTTVYDAHSACCPNTNPKVMPVIKEGASGWGSTYTEARKNAIINAEYDLRSKCDQYPLKDSGLSCGDSCQPYPDEDLALNKTFTGGMDTPKYRDANGKWQLGCTYVPGKGNSVTGSDTGPSGAPGSGGGQGYTATCRVKAACRLTLSCNSAPEITPEPIIDKNCGSTLTTHKLGPIAVTGYSTVYSTYKTYTVEEQKKFQEEALENAKERAEPVFADSCAKMDPPDEECYTGEGIECLPIKDQTTRARAGSCSLDSTVNCKNVKYGKLIDKNNSDRAVTTAKVQCAIGQCNCSSYCMKGLGSTGTPPPPDPSPSQTLPPDPSQTP